MSLFWFFCNHSPSLHLISCKSFNLIHLFLFNSDSVTTLVKLPWKVHRHLCVKIYDGYNNWPTQNHMSGCVLKQKKKNGIIPFFDIWPLSYRSSSKCEWTEQQSHLRCVKFEKHILLFSTLKGLGTGWPIHQNISKKFFWWNFKVKGAVWLSKWCTETKKHSSTDVSMP